MKNKICLSDAVKRLEENSILYELLDLGNEVRILISQYGGKVLGPFVGDGISSLRSSLISCWEFGTIFKCNNTGRFVHCCRSSGEKE